MLEIYLNIYYRFHNIFKAFSTSEKQKNDYTSNVFIFSLVLFLDVFGIFSIIRKILNIILPIPTTWVFMPLLFIILIINAIIIYKNKDYFDSIVDVNKYSTIWLVFVITTIALQFWPLIYILG